MRLSETQFSPTIRPVSSPLSFAGRNLCPSCYNDARQANPLCLRSILVTITGEEEEEEGMALPEGGLIENTHLEILERARKTFARVLVFSVSDVARRTLARFPAGLVLKINYGLTENRWILSGDWAKVFSDS